MPVNRFKNYSPNKPHLVRPGGLKGEVQDLRKDLDDWSIEVSNAIDAGTGGITELTGDVTTAVGTGSQAATVEGLQGNPVSAAAPNVSDVLTWSGTEWAPAAGGGGGLWSKTGTELSPATAGDTVQIEIAVGTAGLTVEDTPASLMSEVRPGVLYLTDNVKVAELNTVSASLLLKGDSGEAPPVVPTITAQDYDSSPTPLDLVVGELRVNGAPGAAGEVLTSNGPGAAPTWQAGGGGGTIAGTIAVNEVAFGTGVDSIGGSAQLEWNPGTGILTVSDFAVTPVLTVDTTSAVVDLAVNELRLAGNAGAAGEVLTSQGAGSAPVWQAPPQLPLTLALTFSHSNTTPEAFAGVYLRSSVTLGAGSEVLVHLPAAGREAEVRLVDLAGTPVASWQSGVATGDEYQAVPVTGTPTLAAGWYNIDITSLSGGAVNIHGMYLTP